MTHLFATLGALEKLCWYVHATSANKSGVNWYLHGQQVWSEAFELAVHKCDVTQGSMIALASVMQMMCNKCRTLVALHRMMA